MRQRRAMGCGASSAAAGGSAIVPGQETQAAEQREPSPPPRLDTRVTDEVKSSDRVAQEAARPKPEGRLPLETAAGPKAVQPAAGAYVRKSKSKRPAQVVTPAAAPLTPEPEPEPEWAALANDPAELARRVCAYMMAHTDRTPSGDARRDARKKVEMGRTVLLKLKSTLSGAGLPKGDSSTRPYIEEFCGWVQTLYFDGISTDEHGAELRQLARAMNQQTEKLLRDQIFSEEPAPTPASAAAPASAVSAVAAVKRAREVFAGDPLVLRANTPTLSSPPPSLTGISESLAPLGSSAGMEACRAVTSCKPTFVRGVEGEWDAAATVVPLGRDQNPAIGYDLNGDWLVTGVALRHSVSMAAAAAAAVAGQRAYTPALLGLEVAQSAEDLQDDRKCTPAALLAWESEGSGKKNAKNNGARSGSMVGTGCGPARWVLDWGLRARYIRLTVLGFTASSPSAKGGKVRLGNLEVHAAYARNVRSESDSNSKDTSGGGKTPRGSRRPPTLERFQAAVLRIEDELAEAVRAKNP